MTGSAVCLRERSHSKGLVIPIEAHQSWTFLTSRGFKTRVPLDFFFSPATSRFVEFSGPPGALHGRFWKLEVKISF